MDVKFSNLMIQWTSRSFRWLIPIAGMIMISCSDGLRLKNFVNYPVIINSLNVLDTMKIQPDVIKYSGSGESSFHLFEDDILIMGPQAVRPIWRGNKQGCLQVLNGASVHILDFNFQAGVGDTSLIRVDSGRVILENCDFRGGEQWVIQVGSAGDLELRNTRFSDLGSGAIILKGGRVKIYNSEFDQAGELAIYAEEGKLLETHQVTMVNTMGTAIQLNTVTEVWLDSLRVINSFQDGINLENCNYVLMNHVESRGNGRNGLSLKNIGISGLLNFSALGNLVQGMVAEAVDTLRILNSEFLGNGENGANILSTNRSRIAGVNVGHNGSNGFNISGGQELMIHHSTFQANPQVALRVDSLARVHIEHSSIVNNNQGIKVSDFEILSLRNNLLASNRGTSTSINSGEQLSIKMNLIKDNQTGLEIDDIHNVHLDSNRVEENKLGSRFSTVSHIELKHNLWISNETACYFSTAGTIVIGYDQWRGNLEHAIEILSADELLMSSAIFKENQNGGLLNQVSARLESCIFDSSSGYALKLLNGSAFVSESTFRFNGVGIQLGEGSQAQLVQSQFARNDLAIDTQASVSLAMSFCNVRQSRGGIRLGNYVKADILANQFDKIEDSCVRLTGPHIQSIKLRQNVMSRTGGIISSQSSSGQITISSNTFAYIAEGLDMVNGTVTQLDHNIFYQTELTGLEMLKDVNSAYSNCFYPQRGENHSAVFRESNLYIDPNFEEKYYLNQQSPCLHGGVNGSLIGALGTLPEKRPDLAP